MEGRYACPCGAVICRACAEREYRHSQRGNTTQRRGEGWITFAAIVLAVAGIMRIFDAIWAFGYHRVLPGNLEAAIFGHSLETYGLPRRCCRAHRMRVPGAQRIAAGPLGQDRGRRDRVHQRHLVDAVLPDLVADLHRPRRSGDLRPRRVRREGRSCMARPGTAVSLPASDAAVPSKAAAHGRKSTLRRATAPNTARTGPERSEHGSWTTSAGKQFQIRSAVNT